MDADHSGHEIAQVAQRSLGAPSLEVFKARLDMTVDNLI